MTALGLLRVLALATSVGLLSAHVAYGASPILQLTNSPASDVRPVWSPDGTRIAFQSNRSRLYQIFIMDADGSNEQRISVPDVDDRHPAWSPDGTRLAVVSGGDVAREVWIVDAGSGERTQVTNLGQIASFPSWSPDGGRLSFYVYGSGTLDLWTVEANGANPRRITNGLASERSNQCTFACHAASWSPDGTRLAYSTANQAQVWTIRAADGADGVRLSPDPDTGRSHFPVYMADGRVLYVTEHITPGQAWTDVWVVRPGSGEQAQALLQDVQAQGPFAFSADGQWLLFSSPRGGNFDIYRVPLNPEGKEAMKVRSADTEPAPALLNRPTPQTEVAARVAAPGSAAGMATPSSGAIDGPQHPGEALAAGQAATEQTGGSGVSPFLVALGVLAVLWAALEILRWQRRRVRGRSRR